MKNRIGRDVPVFGLAMVAGTLLTSGLLLSIILLTNYRAHATEHRPLLVVDLKAWPTPVKQKKQPPVPEPTAKQQLAAKPAPKKMAAKKSPPPLVAERAPLAKRVGAKEKTLEPVKPALTEKRVADVEKPAEVIPTQPVPSSIPTKSEQDTLPSPVPIFQLTQAPRFLRKEMPVYPEVMRTGGISGVVKLEVLIDKKGRVRQVNIVKSAGQHFDEAARHAILASSFYPAKVGREPVAVLLRLPVTFGLL